MGDIQRYDERQETKDRDDAPCDHDWKWIQDWGGDPDVIGGTFDCSRYECTKCGEEDLERKPSSDE